MKGQCMRLLDAILWVFVLLITVPIVAALLGPGFLLAVVAVVVLVMLLKGIMAIARWLSH